MKKGRLALIASGVAALASSVAWILLSPIVLGANNDIFALKIMRGMTFNTIVQTMEKEGVLANTNKLKAAATVLGLKNQMKAGRYEIRGAISSLDLLMQLADGNVAVEWVTIPEGKHARQIAGVLSREIETDSTRFMELVYDQGFVRSLGLSVPNLEGFLFPDTYAFYWGMNPKSVISSMVDQFMAQFPDTLRTRAKELSLTISEVVTLASIIEGEAIVDAERETISAVYWNRIKRGMRLQADPTVQYIIPDGPRRLLNKDLRIDSPYNTYKYRGLPPGPINNPGFASLRAALYPADVPYLYFVANGDGSHTFSRNLREHLRAKSRFDKVRRQVKRRKQTEG